MSQHDTLTLREALRSIQYEAATLSDAQAIALQALNATWPARAQPAKHKHWSGELADDLISSGDVPSVQPDQAQQSEATLHIFETQAARSLQAAWINGWECCRDSEFVGIQAMNDAFSWSTTLNDCLDADQDAQGEPVRHVGDSKFESWFSEYDSKNKGTKQQMRDAYAAGMSGTVAQGAGEVPMGTIAKLQATQEPVQAEPTLRDYADSLIKAGHDFWKACNREAGGGAVRWLSCDDGTLIVFTRGEYRDTIMENIGGYKAPEVFFEEDDITAAESKEPAQAAQQGGSDA